MIMQFHLSSPVKAQWMMLGTIGATKNYHINTKTQYELKLLISPIAYSFRVNTAPSFPSTDFNERLILLIHTALVTAKLLWKTYFSKLAWDWVPVMNRLSNNVVTSIAPYILRAHRHLQPYTSCKSYPLGALEKQGIRVYLTNRLW